MNEKISEKHIREEKIKRLKEKIYSEIDDITKRLRREMYQLLFVDNTDEYFEDDWEYLISNGFYLIKLKEYIDNPMVFQTIIAEYKDDDIVIYQVSDENLDIWLQDDFNFVLTFINNMEFRERRNVYEILNDKYFEYNFVSIFEKVRLKQKK